MLEEPKVPEGGKIQEQAPVQPEGTPIPEGIREELEEARRERDEYRNLLQRVQADFINYKRRVEEERRERELWANAELIRKLLPVLDDFSLAVDQTPETEGQARWMDGVRLIERKLRNILEAEGLRRIEAEGKDFDPWEHEALFYEEREDQEEGKVITVIREGYKLHGRVLRPAQVSVSRRKSQPESKSSEEEV